MSSDPDPRGPDRAALNHLKLVYFTVFASYGTTVLYQSLYWRRVGISDAGIGLLLGIQPLVTIVAGPLWSLAADRLGIRARLLTIVTALTILPTLGMIWLYSYPWLVVLNVLYALLWAPIQPLMDSLALDTLGEERHRYGVVRAFGSMGYAPVAWLTGLAIQGRDIRMVFVAYALLMGLASLLTLRMRVPQTALGLRVGQDLGRLLRDRGWQRFMAATFVAMAVHQVTNSFGGLYLDTLGASEGLIGFSGAIGSGVQTLLMLGALPAMLKRWGSERLLLFSFAMLALRFVLWASIPVPLLAAMNNGLLALTFGTALLAAVDYADKHAPRGLEATSQAMVSSLVTGLGRATGSMGGGALYGALGPVNTFVICAAVALATGLGMGASLRRRAGREASL
ncbi:MAG: MFS transporter [Chloroflexi bacterium]|nr:MFS transporter [Chloroflexota bacterium]